MKLPLFTFNEKFNLESIFSLSGSRISVDFHQQPINYQVEIWFIEDPISFFFGARIAKVPWLMPGLEENEFVAGLWKRDVVELFLKEDGSERYQEFNLAPQGAWWSGFFSEYRKEQELSIRPEVSVQNQIDKTQWHAAMSIRKSSLSVSFSGSASSRANICLILGEQRDHLSWARIAGTKPDFHRTHDFQCCELKHNHHHY